MSLIHWYLVWGIGYNSSIVFFAYDHPFFFENIILLLVNCLFPLSETICLCIWGCTSDFLVYSTNLLLHHGWKPKSGLPAKASWADSSSLAEVAWHPSILFFLCMDRIKEKPWCAWCGGEGKKGFIFPLQVEKLFYTPQPYTISLDNSHATSGSPSFTHPRIEARRCSHLLFRAWSYVKARLWLAP